MPDRVPQQPGSKGSLKWVQTMANHVTPQLSCSVATTLGISSNKIRWVSPLLEDDFAEYRDQGFLDRLDVTLDHYPLRSFWPSRGPQWDALGRADEKIILVEAKAHLAELVSSPCMAGPASLDRIKASLALVKASFGTSPHVDWTARYYQYANRLAHLYLLRQLNNVPAELVHLCFLNDLEMNGPTSAAQWHVAIDQVHDTLGITDHPLLRHLHHVFVDVGDLGSSEQA
jgi:hypothetical protein